MLRVHPSVGGRAFTWSLLDKRRQRVRNIVRITAGERNTAVCVHNITYSADVVYESGGTVPLFTVCGKSMDDGVGTWRALLLLLFSEEYGETY